MKDSIPLWQITGCIIALTLYLTGIGIGIVLLVAWVLQTTHFRLPPGW